MAGEDPTLRGYKWLFDARFGRRIRGGFNKVTGITEEIEVVDKRDGTDPFQVKKLKGTHQGGILTVERGYIRDKDEFLQWWTRVKKNIVPFWTNIVLHLRPADDPKGGNSPAIVSYRFLNAWPSRYELGELDAQSSGLAIEKLGFAHEGLEGLGTF